MHIWGKLGGKRAVEVTGVTATGSATVGVCYPANPHSADNNLSPLIFLSVLALNVFSIVSNLALSCSARI
jgi:hypothetical protein